MGEVMFMTITREQQKEIIELIQRYNNTHTSVVKHNLKKYLSIYKYNKLDDVAEFLGVTIHTIYHWSKSAGNKPSLLAALTLCEYFGITIDKLMEEE